MTIRTYQDIAADCIDSLTDPDASEQMQISAMSFLMELAKHMDAQKGLVDALNEAEELEQSL